MKGVTSCVLQAQLHIAMDKAHRSGEAGKQQPQEQPTATRRQGQQESRFSTSLITSQKGESSDDLASPARQSAIQ